MVHSIAIVQFILIFDFSLANVKIWPYNNDILLPQNQYSNKIDNCEGLHFAPYNEAPIVLPYISTSLIELPITGVWYFDEDTLINFDENSKKCMKIKPFNYRKWFNYKNWRGDFNDATPHIERIPCFWDDVKLPPLHYLAIDITETVYVRTIQTSGKYRWELFDLPFIINSHGHTVNTIYPSNQNCTHPWGCICNENIKIYDICDYEYVETDCKQPILPYGFCHDICGAAIIVHPEDGFKIQYLNEQINVDEDIETHVSRMENEYGEDIIQIIFTERNYTGKSVEEAIIFYEELLKNSKKFFIKRDIEFLKAGVSKIRGSSIVGLFFGTLLGVSTIFGIIFFIYSDYNKWGKFTSLNGVYARFETKGSNLTIHEIGASRLNLTQSPNSFENPLYCSPSTSNDTLKSEESTVTFVNPEE